MLSEEHGKNDQPSNAINKREREEEGTHQDKNSQN
jgi:hypothetical protein